MGGGDGGREVARTNGAPMLDGAGAVRERERGRGLALSFVGTLSAIVAGWRAAGQAVGGVREGEEAEGGDCGSGSAEGSPDLGDYEAFVIAQIETPTKRHLWHVSGGGSGRREEAGLGGVAPKGVRICAITNRS